MNLCTNVFSMRSFDGVHNGACMVVAIFVGNVDKHLGISNDIVFLFLFVLLAIDIVI